MPTEVTAIQKRVTSRVTLRAVATTLTRSHRSVHLYTMSNRICATMALRAMMSWFPRKPAEPTSGSIGPVVVRAPGVAVHMAVRAAVELVARVVPGGSAVHVAVGMVVDAAVDMLGEAVSTDNDARHLAVWPQGCAGSSKMVTAHTVLIASLSTHVRLLGRHQSGQTSLSSRQDSSSMTMKRRRLAIKRPSTAMGSANGTSLSTKRSRSVQMPSFLRPALLRRVTVSGICRTLTK